MNKDTENFNTPIVSDEQIEQWIQDGLLEPKLSPKAQTIVNAYEDSFDKYAALAAVLRAASKLIIEEVSPVEELLNLAAELDSY